MLNRRQLIKNLSSLPLLGGILGANALTAAPSSHRTAGRDYFKELGVRTFINAAGTYTALTGCLMTKEVMDAINYASLQYVNLNELQDKISAEKSEAMLGARQVVLVESRNAKRDGWRGRTRTNYLVFFEGEAAIGEEVEVEITSAKTWTLFGKVAGSTTKTRSMTGATQGRFSQ